MYRLRFQRIFLSGNGPREATNRAVSVLTRKWYQRLYKLHLLSAPDIPDLRTVNRIAASAYRPTVFPGHLTIFRSVNRSPVDGDDELLGWAGMAAGGIEIQDVTGNHLDMLSEPNVRMLSEKLRACLDRAQEPHETHPVGVDLAALPEARPILQPAGATRESKRPAIAKAKTWSALVPIQPNGSRLPLFCLHALGSSLLAYGHLAKYLGPDQPLYALQSPLESQAYIRETSIEELASIYVKELQALFPEGPYHLAGLSLGGL